MDFIRGAELCKRFHNECVEPVLADHFPQVSYASALIGPGSEVLGYDTEMSTDHDWGPRVVLFLAGEDLHLASDVQEALQADLPAQFYGYPVDVRQTVITSIAQFVQSKLAIDIDQGMELLDWLTFPSQTLAELTGGEVFRDDTGQLTTIRQQLHYFPHDIWLYMLASTWNRIGQEEHLLLRAGYVRDELGSSIIGARIVHDIMNLCFHMERQYAPYPKWFGTAFKQLSCADALLPLLLHVQSSGTWREREDALCQAYECIARLHNRLEITEAMTEQVSLFFDRPFKVIQGGTFAQAIAGQISDPIIRKLAQIRLIGGIDQISDNTDFKLMSQWRQGTAFENRNVIRAFYNRILE
ncbi:DUF4037 domain-containing protein [Paenibacillus aestuarii]|uniref:DUF4037 domain-containing protein n=1 Tax=Paenibacillus aestuarii TaxID=516965 RepID=A0ABW0K075_9BACL|nr:DUF4037 domain-containing protein [Paenibacillus aestuarii]